MQGGLSFYCQPPLVVAEPSPQELGQRFRHRSTAQLECSPTSLPPPEPPSRSAPASLRSARPPPPCCGRASRASWRGASGIMRRATILVSLLVRPRLRGVVQLFGLAGLMLRGRLQALH